MYEQKVVRDLFERWGHEEVKGDPGETGSRWTVPLINHIILDQWLPTEGSALDAGCGFGIESIKMVRRGLAVTAVDISTSLLKHAQQRAGKAGLQDQITFIHADITEPLPLPYDSFDVCVALTGVISHTGDRHLEATANLIAHVKHDGLVVVGVDSYYGKIREYLSLGRVDDAEHVAETRFTHTVSDTFEDYCFTPQELVDIFSALKCQLLQMYTAPTIGAYGYVGVSDDTQKRGMALEQRFLGIPELVGAGEQLIAVFKKTP